MKPKFKLPYGLCFAVAAAAFPVILIEALPGVLQLAAWALCFVFCSEKKSIFEIARGIPLNYSWLSFHHLPSGLAFPIAVGVGWLCLQLASLIEKLDYSARERDGELTEKEILAAIEKRKNLASYHRIDEKSRTICRYLGTSGTYREEGISIVDGLRTVIKVSEKTGLEAVWKEVFAAEFSPERTTTSERKYLSPDPGQSRLEIVTEVDSTTWPGSWHVEIFVPGGWQARIDSLFSIAEERRKKAHIELERQREAERRAELDEKRRRFGL